MTLSLLHRRLTTYVYVQDLLSAASVLEWGPAVPAASQYLGSRARQVTSRGSDEPLPEGTFDLVILADPDRAALSARVAEARRRLAPTGTLVVLCESGDRPGRRSGVSYYALADALAGLPQVAILGQAPLAA